MRPGVAGRRALVTGASRGLGRAIARELHRRGAHVVVTARDADALDALVAELGARVEALPADLSERGEVETLLASCGTVDVLVANAALPGSGLLLDFAPEDVDRVVEVNLRAPLRLARALVPGMLERGAGHLVFVGSLSGKVASPRASLYCASKFGLRGFALALREELRGSGVGVTSLAPGFIAGEGMWADARIGLPRVIRLR